MLNHGCKVYKVYPIDVWDNPPFRGLTRPSPSNGWKGGARLNQKHMAHLELFDGICQASAHLADWGPAPPMYSSPEGLEDTTHHTSLWVLPGPGASASFQDPSVPSHTIRIRFGRQVFNHTISQFWDITTAVSTSSPAIPCWNRPEERAAKRCRTSSPTRATIHLEHRGGHFYWIPSHQQWPPRQSKSHFPWRLQGKVTGGRRPQSIICRSGIMVTTFKHQRLERLHPASLLHYAQVAISNGSLEIIDQVKLCLDTWGDSLSRTHCWPCWLSIKQPFGVLKRLWWINLGHDPHSGTPVLAPMKLIHSSHLSYIWCLPYGPQFMRWNERIQY